MRREVYSRADETPTADGGALVHYPRFALSYSFDNQHRPREVTVFEHGEDIATRWLTIDRDHAVPIEEVA